MEAPFPYPHIPKAAQDRTADTLTGPFASEPFRVQRLVPSKLAYLHIQGYSGYHFNTPTETSSREWGDPTAATLRSTQEPIVTAENEELFRTYHPSLALATCVMAMRLRRSEPYSWVIVLGPNTDTSSVGTHVGGREIHFRPAFYLSMA